MKLLLIRDKFTEKCTQGKLLVDGEFHSYTLEDTRREVKVPGETCIWPGTYPITIDFSQKFQKDLPHLAGVQGFEGVRIHPGNGAKDTEGCILVGNVRGLDWLGESKAAFGRLMDKLKLAKDPITLTIVDGGDA